MPPDNPLYHYVHLTLAALLFSFWSSFWPRRFVKKPMEKRIGFRPYRLIYNFGCIFFFGAFLLYWFQNSPETPVLFDLSSRSWGEAIVYAVEGAAALFLLSVPMARLDFWGVKNPPSQSRSENKPENRSDEGPRLNTTGIYRISRHPMYWAVFLFLLGHAFWMGTALAYWGLFLMTAYLVLGVIFLEEPACRESFGAEFEEYRKRCSTVPFLSILRGREELRLSEFDPRHAAGLALFFIFVLLVHDGGIKFLVHYCPTLFRLPEWMAEHVQLLFGS